MIGKNWKSTLQAPWCLLDWNNWYFHCHPTAIHYALKVTGYTRKKKCPDYEQDSEKVAQYLKKFDKLKHLQPVYIDATGCNAYFYREYGRSPRDNLIKGKLSRKRYQRISLVTELVDGKLTATMTIQDTTTSEFLKHGLRYFYYQL